MAKLKILITIKTYPIPSKKYDELVCTAGVTETGEFVRLYPINFRELPFGRQYKKYQWIEIEATKHTGRDTRKESWRPNCETLKLIGSPIRTGSAGNWDERAKFVLPLASMSMEELYEKQKADRTSLGIFKPAEVFSMDVVPDSPKWPPRFLAELKQARLWETRGRTKEPPRKVPWKFVYRFRCDDPRCKGKHSMSIHDWEVGALYWGQVDRGKSPEGAAQSVKHKFFGELCGPDKDTYFYVGTVLEHGTWVITGLFYPKKKPPLLF